MNKNHLIIAAAGAGKTTYLINKALDIISKDENIKILITTYTKANAEQIRNQIKKTNHDKFDGLLNTTNIIVQEWFSFLLSEGVRPYKSILHPELKYKSIGFFLTSEKSGLKINTGKFPVYYPESDTYKFYFTKDLKIYSDKTSKFIFECNKKGDGIVINRICNIYDYIFIDEVQDLAGWDLEIVKLLLYSKIFITLVGDPRQTIYLTNNSGKYEKYKDGNILEFLENECKKSNTAIDFNTLNKSHRFNLDISKVSSMLYPQYPVTLICECAEHRLNQPEHSGIFLVRNSHLDLYKEKYNKEGLQILRYNNSIFPELNIGISKGQTFDRVLIYPTSNSSKIFNFLKSNNLFERRKGKKVQCFDIARFYVAITRARHSVAIVYDFEDNEYFIEGIQKYNPET